MRGCKFPSADTLDGLSFERKSPADKSNFPQRIKGLGINDDIRTRKDLKEQFEQTLMLLNESLGTCLR